MNGFECCVHCENGCGRDLYAQMFKRATDDETQGDAE